MHSSKKTVTKNKAKCKTSLCLVLFCFLVTVFLSIQVARADVTGCGGLYQYAIGYEDNASLQGAAGQKLAEGEICLGEFSVQAWKFGNPTNTLECVLYDAVNGAEIERINANVDNIGSYPTLGEVLCNFTDTLIQSNYFFALEADPTDTSNFWGWDAVAFQSGNAYGRNITYAQSGGSDDDLCYEVTIGSCVSPTPTPSSSQTFIGVTTSLAVLHEDFLYLLDYLLYLFTLFIIVICGYGGYKLARL